MNRHLSQASFTLLALTAAAAPAEAQVEGIGVQRMGLVVGSDDRQAVNAAWLTANPRYQPLVDAVGRFVRTSPEGTSLCTASYIGGGIVVTAGHCVLAPAMETHNRPCDDVTIQWGLRVDASPYLTSQCMRILAAKTLVPYDYAFLEVTPLPRAEIRAVHNAGSSSGVTSPGIMFSHPGGRPLTWSGTCHLPPFASGIAHDCDSEPGSSGALMLEDEYLLAVGIHYGHSGALNSAIYLAHTPVGDMMDSWFKPKGRIVGPDGRCLDVAGGNTADRTPVLLWRCTGDAQQTWSLTPFAALTGLDRKCLDIPVSTAGTQPWLFTCHYGPNQSWRFVDTEFRVGAGKCLDVPGANPANSTRMQLWDCHGGDGQRWTWTPRHEIRNVQGKCLDAASFDPGNGTPVVLYDCHGGANQMWDITGGGLIRGIGGLCLDLTGGQMENGSVLQLYECTGHTAQRWMLRGTVQGLDGQCLQAEGASSSDGAAVVVAPCQKVSAQAWSYYP